MTVYADVLFLVNFSLDYVSLYITGRLLSAPMRTARLCAAAAIGAVYAVSALFFELPEALYIAVTLAVSAVMCLCAYKRGGAAFCIGAAVLHFSVGCALGGAMTAVYSLGAGYGDSLDGGGVPDAGVMAAVAAIAATAVAAGARIAARRRGIEKRRITVKTPYGEGSYDALCDSGNLLRDPVSCRAAVIISADAARAILPRELIDAAKSDDIARALDSCKPEDAARVRLLPVSNVYGRGMLVGYRPDCVSSDGREYDFILAISDKKDGFGGCDAIFPAEAARAPIFETIVKGERHDP